MALADSNFDNSEILSWVVVQCCVLGSRLRVVCVDASSEE